MYSTLQLIMSSGEITEKYLILSKRNFIHFFVHIKLQYSILKEVAWDSSDSDSIGWGLIQRKSVCKIQEPLPFCISK